MTFQGVIKKWGNSYGILLPKEVVKEQGLKVNEKVGVNISRMADFSKTFGTLKRKMTGQQFKDMVREGWDL